jgi:hypothetical protein
MTNTTFPNQETIDSWINRSVRPLLVYGINYFEDKRRAELAAQRAREEELLAIIGSCPTNIACGFMRRGSDKEFFRRYNDEASRYLSPKTR